MSYLLNNQQKINDIIFTDRNKIYGAYAIRSAYGNTIVKSISIMLTGLGLICSITYFLLNREIEKTQETIIAEHFKVTEFIFEAKKKEIPQANNVPQKNNSSKSNSIATAIIDSAEVHTNTVTIDNVSSNTGSTIIGNDNGGTSTVTSKGTGSVIGTSTLVAEDTHYFVDSEPEFEGGLKALYQFLASNLKYPTDAIEVGKEGTIHLKFVVDKDGKVCDIIPQNKLGFGLDQEALRVASLIPKFKKPGMMKGQAVKVYYQLPIKFKLR